jgi:hypothetical protein
MSGALITLGKARFNLEFMMVIRNSALILFCSFIFSAHARAQTELDDIYDMVADLSCDSSNQCKAVGIGKMHCGGPDRYLNYSTKTVNETDLDMLVSEYNNNIVLAPDMVGICSMAPQPIGACIAHRCSAEAPLPVVRPQILAGGVNSLVVDMPAVVYIQGLEHTISANGVHVVGAVGKTVYRVRLVSFIDENDGELKFRIESLSEQE